MSNSWLAPSTEVFDMMQRDFEISLKDRLVIWAEVDKYRWKEDESVWRQKRDKSAMAYEVTFDGEFVCFFDTSHSKDEVRILVLEGMRKLFSEGKVFYNKEMYVIKEEERKAEEKVVEIEAPASPEDWVVAEVIKKQAKRKKKKIVIKKRKPNVF